MDEDEDYDMEEELEAEEVDVEQGSYGGYEGAFDSGAEEYSKPEEIMNRRMDEGDIKEILDERILKQYYEEPKDKEIADFDLPERQILRYKPYAKMENLSLEDIKLKFESEDRRQEAKWIYEKLREQKFF